MDKLNLLILPYTRRDLGNKKFRLSYFSQLATETGLLLWRANQVKSFLLPGEQRNPSTCDLETDYLVQNGVPNSKISCFPNVNGTLQQLEPIAKLQKQKKIGSISILAFHFHIPRTKHLIKVLRIDAEILEVEETYLKLKYPNKTPEQLQKQRLKMLAAPFMQRAIRAETGIVRYLFLLDKPFGTLFPISRLSKLLMGPSITDKDKIGLVRLEKIKNRFKF